MGLWAWLTGNQDGDNDSVDKSASAETPGQATTATLESCDGAAFGEEAESPAPWWAPEGAELVEPPPVERPDLSTEARALESALVSHFDGHDLAMPTMPVVVAQVLSCLRKPNCDLKVIADKIAEDQVAAAAVLRMTNSPLYRGLHKVTALRPAVTRLGVKAIHTLMMHETVRAAMFHKAGKDKALAQMLWRCSLASACIMRELSEFTSANKEDAFLMGLLHDIGSVIVLRIAHDQRKYTNYDIDVDTFDYLCGECHQEFGELVAQEWKLPESLKALISDHHVYPGPEDPLRTERLLIQLTDMISGMLGYAPPVSYNLLETRAIQDLGIGQQASFTSFLNELPAKIEEAVHAL